MAAFETVCGQDDQRVERSMRVVQDAATKGVIALLEQTRFSSLVRAVMSNATLAPLVWTAGQPRPQGRTTQPTPIVYVPEATYLRWYGELRTNEDDFRNMALVSISVHEALAHRGIIADGCGFLAGQVTPTASEGIVTSLERSLQADPVFQSLLALNGPAESNRIPTSRFAIALELLYLVRNGVMHGALDPTAVANDPVGRAAQQLLYSWLDEFA